MRIHAGEAVEKLLKKKWRRGLLKMERIAEAGPESNLAGFSWRREAAEGGKGGLRGITIIECDASGAIANGAPGSGCTSTLAHAAHIIATRSTDTPRHCVGRRVLPSPMP